MVPAAPASYNSSGTVTATLLESTMGGLGGGMGQGTFHPNWQHCTQTPAGDIFVTYNYYDYDAALQGHVVTYFRVKWSSNYGATFTTIYDSNVAGQIELDYGMPPHIESDANGNVYVIQNHYPRTGSSQQTRVTKIHKFAPPYNQTYTNANYGTGAGTLLGSIAQCSNKWSAYYDQTRGWFWICFWQDTSAANLYAVDMTGTTVFSKNIFNVKPGPTISMSIASPAVVTETAHGLSAGSPIRFFSDDRFPTGVTFSPATTYYVITTGLTANTYQFSATPGGAAVNTTGSQAGSHWRLLEFYGTATYPCLAMINDGTLIVGWTAESSELITPNVVQGYYDARFIYSSDAGATFVGPNGTVVLPVWADSSYPAANRAAYHLAHDGVDYLDGADPNYGSDVGQHYNWNHLNHLIFNSAKLHINYQSESSDAHVFGYTANGAHDPHVRFDWVTKAVDYRREPSFDSDAGDAGNGGTSYHIHPGNMGSFSQDTTQTRRLYYVGQGRADQGNLGKISVLKCDNPAAATPNWLLYAKQAASIGTTNGLVDITSSRWVQSDGGIIGICQQADSPFAIYFFRVA